MSKLTFERKRKSARLLSRTARIVAEVLEQRVFLSASLSGTTLNVTGTSGADTFTLSDSGSTITVKQGASTFTFADSSVGNIVVNPTAGGDTVNLLSNTKPVSIIGGGLDTVNIGDGGSLMGISASVDVSNPSSFTSLTVDGSNLPGPAQHEADGLMDGSSINIVSGLITYNAGELSALDILTQNSLDINNTGVLHDNAPTIVTSGLTHVRATTGPLTLNPVLSAELDIGDTHAQTIQAPVVINNPASTEEFVYVDDAGDGTGRTGVISAGTNSITVTGFSPAAITINGVNNGTLLGIYAGGGNDTIDLGADVPDSSTFVYAGAGNDTVVDTGGTRQDTIYGQDGDDTLIYTDSTARAVFDGGTGDNTLTLDQSNASFASHMSATSGSISDSGFLANPSAGVTYNPATVDQININLGVSNDSVATSADVTIPMIIHGGAGNDSLQGGSANNTIFGDAGNDTLIGGVGDDSLNGGPGTDVLTGGDGIDTLDGGDGLPVQIIADNVANLPVGSSEGVTATGNWIPSTSNSGFYGTNYFTDNNSLKGTKNVKFTPNIPVAGSYQVYARWTASSNRSNHVPISVTHQGVTTTVFENQQTNNNAWVLLGTHTLSAGTGSSVTVSNTGTTGYVIADAVRFVPVVATATISGTVFNDVNANGKQDAGEIGIPGRVVYIDSNKDGILDNNEARTTTDAAGDWTLSGLAAGTYRVREQNVAGVRHTDPTGSANFYDVTVTTGSSASAIYGKLFGEQEMTTTPAPVLAINAGGPAFVLNSGFTYGADSGFTGGTAATTVFDVGNTDNDPIYYSYRSGSSFSYSIAVPNGNYSLVLNFVDPTKTAAGQRKFNVTVEGKQVLTNFDIVASAGAKTAISKAFNVTVTGGTLTISLQGVVDNAILSGIVLYPA